MEFVGPRQTGISLLLRFAEEEAHRRSSVFLTDCTHDRGVFSVTLHHVAEATVMQKHPADDRQPRGQQIRLAGCFQDVAMQGHILLRNRREVLVFARDLQPLDHFVQAVDVGIGELAEHSAKGEHLDLSPQFDHQPLDLFARGRADPDATVGLGDEQPFLRQLEQRIADGGPAHAVRLGQGLFAETGSFR
jgi:hypothetical protein